MTDPDGSPVSMVLRNPPASLALAPLRDAAPGSRREAVWFVAPEDGAQERLEFETWDRASPDVRVRQTLNVRVVGSPAHQGRLVGDVDGDGRLDVVGGSRTADLPGAPNAGAVYVWSDPAGPDAAPLATLLAPSPTGQDQLGGITGQGVKLADVTGDGILDVIAASRQEGTGNRGAVHVWEGGATLSGSPAPRATLTIPAGVNDDLLGNVGTGGQGLLVADVTGDGIADLVVGASSQGFNDAGAVYVWAGGGALLGTPPPRATLRTPLGRPGDRLGDLGSRQGIRVAEVTGDGQPDLVVGAPSADLGGVSDVGAVFVWAGGAGLTGVPAPTATLTRPSAVAGDRLGDTDNQGLAFAELTGDGQLDVIVGARFAGTDDAGAVLVFAGGTGLVGTPAPTVELAGIGPDDWLGFAGDGPGAEGILVREVTGDGQPDLVLAVPYADLGSGTDVGAVLVFAGGPGFTGTPAPTATLVSGTIDDEDLVGELGIARGVQFAEVTGDAHPDVVALSWRGGPNDTGRVLVWAGGPALSGFVPATARLELPVASSGLRLGWVETSQGVLFADLDDDGQLDVLVGAERASPGGVGNAGAAWLWRGGATLVGQPPTLATLRLPGGSPGDRLGDFGGQGLFTADVTGDGRADAILGARAAGPDDDGEVAVWAGGPALAGLPDPEARLTATGFGSGLRLGDGFQQALSLVDVDDDAVLDLLVAAPLADVGTDVDAGALFLWSGGATLTGTPGPAAALLGPGSASDGLGRPRAVDLDGDGRLDVLGGALGADVDGVFNAGAFWMWLDLATAPGLANADARLRVPGASAGDQLGF